MHIVPVSFIDGNLLRNFTLKESFEAKDNFKERAFNYKMFSKGSIKIFTDIIHGKRPMGKHSDWLIDKNYIELIAFLSFDGQLSWKNGWFLTNKILVLTSNP